MTAATGGDAGHWVLHDVAITQMLGNRILRGSRVELAEACAPGMDVRRADPCAL
jgi:hypothetical protein